MVVFSGFNGSASYHGKQGETIDCIIKNAAMGALKFSKIDPDKAFLLVALGTNDSHCTALQLQSDAGLNRSEGNESDVPAFDVTTNSMGGVGLIRDASQYLFNNFIIANEKGAYYTGEVDAHSEGQPLKAIHQVMESGERKLNHLAGIIFVHKRKALAQTVAEQLEMTISCSIDITAGPASLAYAFAYADVIAKSYQSHVVVAEVMHSKTNYLASAVVISPVESPGFIIHSLNSPGIKQTNHSLANISGYANLAGATREQWEQGMDEPSRTVLVAYNCGISTIEDAKKNPVMKDIASIIQPEEKQSVIECLDKAFMTNEIKDNDYVGIMGLGPSGGINVYRF